MRTLDQIIEHALDEDIGFEDITTDTIIDRSLSGVGEIKVKESAIVAGLDIAGKVFEKIDPEIEFESLVKEGDSVEKNTILANVKGRISSILKGERTALNFLMRLSGIATITNQYVKELDGTNVVLLDTRKTTPGLRLVEKYAVKMGGGTNHRFGLFDGILIKDNHIKATGSIREAIRTIKSARPYHKVEIEVKNIEELKLAIEAGADIVLLDNMELKLLEEAIKLAKNRVLVEVSGNITLNNLKAVANLKPDFISSGAITHSARAIDISLKITDVYRKGKA
ncbi:MAG: carboxylating nicotinate-nucleotide diphosphorylase [bacterium]